MPKFSNAEKVAELEYEIGMRHRVYPRLVEQRKMTLKECERKIAVMREMADEYRSKDDMFGGV